MRRIKAKHLVGLYHSLSFKLFLVLLVMIILLFGIYSTLHSKFQNKINEDTIGLAAYRVSDMAKKSLYRLMLLNERDELYQTILLLGSEPGMERIRIFNKKGEIKFSTEEFETGKIVDMKAEACYVCHTANQPIVSLPIQKKRRIYQSNEGRRIMGLINPIRNSKECSESECHAHNPEQTILGVLDVQMSMGELDQAVLRTRITVFTLSIGLTIFSMILFALIVYLIIYRPIHTLQSGMVKLASGELNYRIDIDRKDELGMLAVSFNNMAEKLKGAYDRMLEVEKMTSLGKMAATVAHELNNPLSGIVTYVKLLTKRILKEPSEKKDRDKIQKELELVLSESLRCGNIVRNLLEFARGSTANFQQFKLKDIIERAMQIVGHHIELANIEAAISINIQPDKVVCDPDQLIQAFVALFVNAVEVMPNGGRLELNAHNIPNDRDRLIIEISDTGPGIPADLKKRIFEPFFSTKKEKTGVGLGLAVVYGIIQRHNGKIWLDSQEGKGTTFYIELPINPKNMNN